MDNILRRLPVFLAHGPNADDSAGFVNVIEYAIFAYTQFPDRRYVLEVRNQGIQLFAIPRHGRRLMRQLGLDGIQNPTPVELQGFYRSGLRRGAKGWAAT
jgi:hypothetical protein